MSAVAYDPVQSLLAVGTNETKFGEGQIYVFGWKRVNVVLQLPRRGSVKSLHFCADKLICFDRSNDVLVYSLESKRLIGSYSPPGRVFAVCVDPALDYVLLGMQGGDVIAFDLEHGRLAPFNLPNFWREKDPRVRAAPVMALALHPRDIGTLLIGYAEGAVTYSFKQNKPTRFFQYEIPRGAPGGDGDPRTANTVRHPRLSHAVWHPTGTFILTGHEDGSLVFWDVKDGRVVLARTLTDVHVDKPGGAINVAASTTEREPFFKLVWCANHDPEDTAVLVAGGSSVASPTKSLTLFELGRTPVYATSSWQILTAYLETPKRQRMLPIPPGTEVIDFCMIPKSSPHFAGAQEPIATVAVLASGEIITMSFPSGFPISPTNQLHVSLSFVHPFVNSMNLSPVERGKWLGMVEKRNNGPPLMKGGAEVQRPLKRFEHRNIVQTAHADGTIRIWDAGHGDEIENAGVLQVDVDRAAGRPEGTEITKMSLSGASGELAVGTRAGDILLFRWGHNRFAGREQQGGLNGRPGEMVDISNRADPTLTEGLLPLTMVNIQNGPVTCLKLADVGFLAAGFEGGAIVVIDLRGPAIIYNGNVQEFSQQSSKRHSGRADKLQSRGDHPTNMEFSVMTLEGESWSSILLHVGTQEGRLATFKVIPQGGRYSVQLAGVVAHDGPVVRIAPISADSGSPTYASQSAVAGLREGRKVNGVLLVVSEHGARISKPVSTKGAHKSWDGFVVQSAAVSRCDEDGLALVTLSSDGIARVFSIPALKEIGGARLNDQLDPYRANEALITSSGDILAWSGPAETTLLNIWGRGLVLYVLPSPAIPNTDNVLRNKSKDLLFNPEAIVPPRPTISNVQWLAGTQHVTTADLDLLSELSMLLQIPIYQTDSSQVGGPDRLPSKRSLASSSLDPSQPNTRSTTAAGGTVRASNAPASQDEGYWAYMQRTVAERTQNLNLLGDSVNNLEQQSSKWAEDASKYVAKQKRNLVLGAVKGKFGI